MPVMQQMQLELALAAEYLQKECAQQDSAHWQQVVQLVQAIQAGVFLSWPFEQSLQQSTTNPRVFVYNQYKVQTIQPLLLEQCTKI